MAKLPIRRPGALGENPDSFTGRPARRHRRVALVEDAGARGKV